MIYNDCTLIIYFLLVLSLVIEQHINCYKVDIINFYCSCKNEKVEHIKNNNWVWLVACLKRKQIVWNSDHLFATAAMAFGVTLGTLCGTCGGTLVILMGVGESVTTFLFTCRVRGQTHVTAAVGKHHGNGTEGQ